MMRSSRKKESSPAGIENSISPIHNKEYNRSASWADPNDLSQLLDFFTPPPVRTLSIQQVTAPMISTRRIENNQRRGSVTYERASDQKSLNKNIPSSMPHDSDFVDSPKKMPLKAQRLMGLDTTMTYQRSTFEEWEDEEELQSAISSPLYRRSLVRRSRGDSHMFRSPPKIKAVSPRQSSLPRQSPTAQEDMTVSSKPLPLPSRENAASKWLALSQRFRNNSTVPLPMRLKRTNSSPSKAFFEDFASTDSMALKAPSPTRTASLTETPTTSFFSSLSGKLSSESKREIERSEWAEARASTKALKNTMDVLCHKQESTTSLSVSGHQSSDSASSDVPLQIIRGTQPLRFNPNRRPRAPFPASNHLDSSSADEANVPSQSDASLLPPTIRRCPSKMQKPNRSIESPLTLTSLPPRPRRPSESNIFADNTIGSKLNHTPPRRPPPRSPIPALPPLPSKTKECEKSDVLAPTLDVGSTSHLVRSSEADSNQTDAEPSPPSIVFCGQEIAEPFSAKVERIEGGRKVKSAQVQLIVGGVQFDLPLSLLLSRDGEGTSEGLVACLRRQQRQGASFKGNASLCVPIQLKHRQSKNSVNSYDEGSSASSTLDMSSSSEDDSDEEEFGSAFAYQTSSLSLNWSLEKEEKVEKEVLSPVEALQLTTPHRSLAHARTPTSVSLDCESVEDEEGEVSNDTIHRRNSATPELIGPNTFIFTTYPPPTQQQQPLIPISSSLLRVTLQRDPQPYSFLLHLFKHDTFPSFFSDKRFPLLNRRRALSSLQAECLWLGYSSLAKKCKELLESITD